MNFVDVSSWNSMTNMVSLVSCQLCYSINLYMVSETNPIFLFLPRQKMF